MSKKNVIQKDFKDAIQVYLHSKEYKEFLNTVDYHVKPPNKDDYTDHIKYELAMYTWGCGRDRYIDKLLKEKNKKM